MTTPMPTTTTKTTTDHDEIRRWFRKSEEQNLAFVYQDSQASGEDSTFFKLVRR
jgi:hypothetical protein